jgi:hypothetical protein
MMYMDGWGRVKRRRRKENKNKKKKMAPTKLWDFLRESVRPRRPAHRLLWSKKKKNGKENRSQNAQATRLDSVT